MSNYEIAHIIFLVMVAVLFVVPAFMRTSRNTAIILRNLAVWLGIAVIISLAYQWFVA